MFLRIGSRARPVRVGIRTARPALARRRVRSRKGIAMYFFRAIGTLINAVFALVLFIIGFAFIAMALGIR